MVSLQAVYGRNDMVSIILSTCTPALTIYQRKTAANKIFFQKIDKHNPFYRSLGHTLTKNAGINSREELS